MGVEVDGRTHEVAAREGEAVAVFQLRHHVLGVVHVEDVVAERPIRCVDFLPVIAARVAARVDALDEHLADGEVHVATVDEADLRDGAAVDAMTLHRLLDVAADNAVVVFEQGVAPCFQ